MSKQYQGQPAEGYKPLEEWGEGQAFSSEELEAWKRSPITRLESRVIATIADLEADNARLQARVKELKHHLEMDDPRLLESVELTAKVRKERDGYKALAERRGEFLQKHGKHGLLCRYGLLPAGVRRRSFSVKEDARLEKASIKECTCGLLAALAATPEG